MEEVFFDNPNDKGLLILLKREANIILASLDKNSNEYLYKKELFENTISVVKAIEYTNISFSKLTSFICTSCFIKATFFNYITFF